MIHQEDYDYDLSEEEQYFEGYDALSVHEVMLNDKPRMDFYHSVLSKEEIQNQIVVDVGAGSGVLSCWAAKAGSKHVFAIEASSISKLLPATLLENNMHDVVSLIPYSVKNLVEKGVDSFIEEYSFIKSHPSGISVIVSEWMGFYLLHEGMLEAVLMARDFFQEVNDTLGVSTRIQLIPSEGHIYAAPISLLPIQEENKKKWENIYGLNFSSLGALGLEERLESSSPLIESIPESCLLHEGKEAWSFDFCSLKIEELDHLTSSCTFSFPTSERFKKTLLRSGSNSVAVDGIVVWFSVSHKAHTLDTSPLCPPTHWKQTTILLPKEYRDDKIVSFSNADMDSLTVNLEMRISDAFKRCYQISYELQ